MRKRRNFKKINEIHIELEIERKNLLVIHGFSGLEMLIVNCGIYLAFIAEELKSFPLLKFY